MIETLLLAFIPLFVAVDVLGVLPLFISLTQRLEEHRDWCSSVVRR
jgi:small neutral amino acid transporter SnatA (MarC family)